MSEEIVQNEEVELELDEIEEEVEETEEETEESELIDWKARAMKAEQLLISRKKLEKQSKQNVPVQKTDTTLTEEAIDTKILKMNGYTDDQIAQLKKIARVNGTSLIDAKQDPYFISWRETQEAENTAKKARLGASKGSGTVRKEKSFATPGLSDEEHKALWRRSQGL